MEEVLLPADADEPAPAWADWAASIAEPPPPEVSPDAVEFGAEGQDHPSTIGQGFFGGLVSSLLSLLIHLVALILLGLWITADSGASETVLHTLLVHRTTEEDRISELETVLLDEDLTPGSQMTPEQIAAPQPESEPSATDQDRLLDQIDLSQIATELPIDALAGIWDRLDEFRPRTSDDAQATVSNYGQALDHITQEILRIAAKEKVLIVWCFDQSGSMKDDQQEIRGRLERVYAELGATGLTSDDTVLTAVTSFGREFLVHTEQPTADLDAIRGAIDAVPVDPSGEEMMCSAVIRSVAIYHESAKRQKRRMAIVLVSDESGNAEESETYLEAAIGHAVAARSKVYILGREAVFGYPFAHVRWVHPQTGQAHELPMDRGPETAFFEVLGTDGFGPRTDAHPSGFGPYAQSRLAWRTGGVFFMLPSVETDLVGGEGRRYDPYLMRDYRPDLRSREEIVAEAQRHPLRPIAWKIVNDLDPYDLKSSRMMNLPLRFPAEMARFTTEMREAQTRSATYLAGLERGIKALDANVNGRDREPSLRWQANYDLLRAQVVGYAARSRSYRAALAQGFDKVSTTPRTLPPNKELSGWTVREKRERPADETTVELLERSIDLYLEVVKNHPETPWADRAEWELHRDFNYPIGASATAAGLEARDDRETAPRAGRRAREKARVGGPGWGLDRYPGFEMVAQYRAGPSRPKYLPDRSQPEAEPTEPMPGPDPIPIPRL